MENSSVGLSRKIPLAMPVFDKEMEKAAVDALSNERFVLGESVYKFEEEFAKYCGVDYAVSTSSGTNALQIALVAAGLSPRRARCYLTGIVYCKCERDNSRQWSARLSRTLT